MKVAISLINVENKVRIRQDNGDIKQLEESIAKVGLLNPIVVDENYDLIAGFRRYTACRSLGLPEIEVTVVKCEGDKHKLLDIELAENIARKDFTEAELNAAVARRNEINEELRGGIWKKIWTWMKNLLFPYEPAILPAPEKEDAPAAQSEEAELPAQEEEVVEPVQQEAK